MMMRAKNSFVFLLRLLERVRLLLSRMYPIVLKSMLAVVATSKYEGDEAMEDGAISLFDVVWYETTLLFTIRQNSKALPLLVLLVLVVTNTVRMSERKRKR